MSSSVKCVTFGEIMLRLSPPGYERFFQSPVLQATFGGGEANVAVSLAHFGVESHYVSRVPANPIAQALLEELGEPLMSSTLQLPGSEYPEVDPQEIRDRLERELGLVIDGGGCRPEPTTVVDMTEGTPQLVREGLGPVEAFV